MLRRSMFLAGLMAVGCTDDIPIYDAGDVPSADALAASDLGVEGGGFDAGAPDLPGAVDVPAVDVPAAMDAPAVDAPASDGGAVDAPTDVAVDAVVAIDAGTADSGTADAGTADAGTADSGAAVDSGTADSGAAVDAGAADVPPAPTATPGECSSADRERSPGLNVDSDTADSYSPAVVWTGSEFGVAWSDLRHATPEIYFVRFGDPTVPRAALPTLTRVTTEPATGAGTNEQPSIAWDGTRYWIAWSRSAPSAASSIRVASVTPTGAADATVGAPVTVSTGTQGYTARPSLVALPAGEGGGLAVAWEDDRATDNAEVYFARLGATGARVGPEVRVTTAEGLSGWPRLVHGPAAELGLAWVDERDGAAAELYFTRLTLAGARPAGAADVRVTHDPFVTAHPSLAWDGTGYGVAWEGEAGVADRPAVFFALLGAGGARRSGSTDLRLSSNLPGGAARHPALAWSGTGYLALWQDERPTHTGGDLALQRLSASGARVGPETFLYDDADASQHPALIWAGTQFLVAWEDEQYMHRDIWYRRILPGDCLP